MANIRQQAQQAKDTYDQLDTTFDSVLASYDTGDGTIIGEINDNYFCKCLNKPKNDDDLNGCTNEKYFFAKDKTPKWVKQNKKNLQ